MLFINIRALTGVRDEQKPLRQRALDDLSAIENAYLRIEHGKIADFGPMKHLPATCLQRSYQVRDVSGSYVLPAWCDSHTHAVFAGSRENEFEDKIKGVSYEEIARKGGGILSSAHLIAQTDEAALYEQALARLKCLQQYGTGAIEIKSGYGLDKENELKILRVIRRLKETSDMVIKATFLGAHTYPPAYKNDHAGYIREITENMLPEIAAEGLADFIDVFCEQGFFSVEETDQILEAGIRHGLVPKLHANQLHCSGGVQTGIRHGAISVDHLENIGPEEIACLQDSATIGTLLPTAAFFLRLPWPPARQLIDAGAAIALATDYNPGSSPSGNMPLLLAMSCIQMRMTPAEVINAATFNGACAMQVQDRVGSIAVGKQANLIVTTPMPSLPYWFYAFGDTHIKEVIVAGKKI